MSAMLMVQRKVTAKSLQSYCEVCENVARIHKFLDVKFQHHAQIAARIQGIKYLRWPGPIACLDRFNARALFACY